MNEHCRDSSVHFDPETHTYSINGKSDGITIVTKLVSSCFGTFNATEVIERCYDEWQADEKSRYRGRTKEDIKISWELNKNWAAEQGRRLHSAIESFYTRSNMTYDTSIKEWSHFVAFQDKFNLVPYRVEMVIWSEEHMLGGTIDLVVQNKDGTMTLYDWKRCKDKINITESNWGRYCSGLPYRFPDNHYFRYSMQLNLYREMLERYYGFSIRDMFLVRLHPEAISFEVTEVLRMENETNLVLERRRDECLDAEA